MKERPILFSGEMVKAILDGRKTMTRRVISGRDIEAEGFAIRYTMPGAFAGLDEFRALWDCLNAKRGYGWDANPWCWVISFKRTS